MELRSLFRYCFQTIELLEMHPQLKGNDSMQDSPTHLA